MNDIKEAINPDTGRKLNGQFAKGHTFSRRKRKPSEITADVRQYADQENVTIDAVKRLKQIVANKDGKATMSEVIRASEVLLKHFNITFEKDVDKQIADEGNKTIAEMFDDLKQTQSNTNPAIVIYPNK